MFPEKDIVEEAAIELGVDPSFVEKDWYALQVLESISELVNGPHIAVFSGGTSLSKGYNLIKRFSEDLDFYVQADDPQQIARNDLRAYRESLWVAIERIPGISIKDGSRISRNRSNFFSGQLVYPQLFEPGIALRPELKVEFTFLNPDLTPELRPLNTIIGQLSGDEPTTSMLCIRPEETGSDKFSALTWRILVRDRNSVNDDPAMIRHAHDLYALQKVCAKDQDGFSLRVHKSFDQDKVRANLPAFDKIGQAAEAALEILKMDELYRKEYASFVDSMFYGTESQRITFEMAIEAYEYLLGKLS